MIVFKKYYCEDCNKDEKVMEYYMVQWDLWAKYGCGKGQLCIACLEKRMGRKLVAADFINAPINDMCDYVVELRKQEQAL